VSGFIVVVVLLGLVWLFIVLPVRRRQRATSALHEAMQDSLVVGDEIITAGGLYAVVREIDHDRLEIEIAPDVIVSLDRRAVAAVAEDAEEDEDDEDDVDDVEDHETRAEEPEPENDGEPR
jgi:preprotein translocase subunit YajC